MATRTGLDILAAEDFSTLHGKKIGIVCNQAAVTSNLEHVVDRLTSLHRNGRLRLAAIFGPQHGLFGHTQDNMVEWEGSSENRWGVPVYSLYGENRSPRPNVLKELDLLIIDLPDIGARYYTFLWTTALCLQVCEATGTSVLVLDRPNPIGGLAVEGPVLEPEFASFVGLYPLPTRHGLTLGEVAGYFQKAFFPRCQLEVERIREWSRSDHLDDTDVPWIMPSPNMPTLDTAFVYPGGCLLEGSNLSEGRGTTRPFEIFGAPYLDGWKLCTALNDLQLPGCVFRPIQFQPTFQKHRGEVCEGGFVHVLDRRAFEPVITFVAALQEVRRQTGDALRWNDPPYEYEALKLPIDILAGNDWIREAIDNLVLISEIRERLQAEAEEFRPLRETSLLYPFGA